jgi:hypothetical protein
MTLFFKNSRTMSAAWVLAALLLVGMATQGTARAAGPVTVTKIASPQKALRFEVTVPASLDEVWAAFTTPDGLAAWLW